MCCLALSIPAALLSCLLVWRCAKHTPSCRSDMHILTRLWAQAWALADISMC